MNFNRFLRQDATYWAQTGLDEFNHPAWGAPIHVKVRWEDKTFQILNKDGNLTGSKSKIMSTVPFLQGNQLYLGVSNASDPASLPLAAEIISVDTIPDLRNPINKLYIAYL